MGDAANKDYIDVSHARRKATMRKIAKSLPLFITTLRLRLYHHLCVYSVSEIILECGTTILLHSQASAIIEHRTFSVARALNAAMIPLSGKTTLR